MFFDKDNTQKYNFQIQPTYKNAYTLNPLNPVQPTCKCV